LSFSPTSSIASTCSSWSLWLAGVTAPTGDQLPDRLLEHSRQTIGNSRAQLGERDAALLFRRPCQHNLEIAVEYAKRLAGDFSFKNHEPKAIPLLSAALKGVGEVGLTAVANVDVAALAKLAPDVLVADIDRQEVDALELLRQLRFDRRLLWGDADAVEAQLADCNAATKCHNGPETPGIMLRAF
jgi:CheY-like chemotaxis protein